MPSQVAISKFAHPKTAHSVVVDKNEYPWDDADDLGKSRRRRYELVNIALRALQFCVCTSFCDRMWLPLCGDKNLKRTVFDAKTTVEKYER